VPRLVVAAFRPAAFLVAFLADAGGRFEVVAGRLEAVLRTGWRFDFPAVSFWRLPLDEREERADELDVAADFERDLEDFVEREARRLAALRRVELPAAGRLRARPGERGVFDLAIRVPFSRTLTVFR